MGKLPPEIGRVLEQLFGEAAAKVDGDWIADYAEFEDTVFNGIKVSRLHIKDEDMAGLVSKSVGRYSTLQTGPLNEYERLEDICCCLGYDEFEYAKQALQAGVSEYILKPINVENLLGVMRRLRETLTAERQKQAEYLELKKAHYRELRWKRTDLYRKILLHQNDLASLADERQKLGSYVENRFYASPISLYPASSQLIQVVKPIRRSSSSSITTNLYMIALALLFGECDRYLRPLCILAVKSQTVFFPKI